MNTQFAQKLYKRHYHRYDATALGLFLVACLVFGFLLEPMVGVAAAILLLVAARLYANRMTPDETAGEGHFPHEIESFTVIHLVAFAIVGVLLFGTGHFLHSLVAYLF